MTQSTTTFPRFIPIFNALLELSFRNLPGSEITAVYATILERKESHGTLTPFPKKVLSGPLHIGQFSAEKSQWLHKSDSRAPMQYLATTPFYATQQARFLEIGLTEETLREIELFTSAHALVRKAKFKERSSLSL